MNQSRFRIQHVDTGIVGIGCIDHHLTIFVEM